MRILPLLCATLLAAGGALVAAAPVHAQAERRVDLTGSWTFDVTTDAGSGTPGVVLRQQGDSLSGRYSSQIFGEADMKGKVTGREFTLELTVSAEGQTLAVVYKGTIESADELKGTVAFGNVGSGSFTARRRPPSLPPPAP